MTPSSSEPPEAAPPPGLEPGGFCQLVRIVSPPTLFWPVDTKLHGYGSWPM